MTETREKGGVPTYALIRSGRRTLALEVTREGRVVVRAPMGASQAQISAFVSGHAAWIEKHLDIQRQRRANHPEPTGEEREACVRRAREELPGKVAKYSALMGLYPTGLTVTGAKTRFGSCSGKNRLCFSWRLMRYPEEAVDYVVVHELAHIRHKDHSKAFYACIEEILPDWRERRKLLRE